MNSDSSTTGTTCTLVSGDSALLPSDSQTSSSTSVGQDASSAHVINQESAQHNSRLSTRNPHSSASSSHSSFRSHLFSKLGRKHERPVEAPRSKGPMGLNTLYDPGETALVDIIFIHGLAGGSRKTWSSSHDLKSFWPQAWLPKDPDFVQARIHSFGYDADWRDRSLSILSLHDFGRDLLAEMQIHPSIRRSQTQIIMVGHSMGGCIAKKVYVLARENPSSERFASRFHSVFFLGTPHRGSNLATFIQNWLHFTGVSKPYLVDLSSNSAALVALNSSFEPFAQDLHIWSFFETRPVSERPEILVVDKFSATLGFSNEEVLSMDADHRRICKFNDTSDPNYRKLRNALSTAINMIKLKAESCSVTASRARLESYLEVDDSYQDDLSISQETRLPGSCAWFTEHGVFSDWMTSRPDSPSILWLTGQPGTGKSIICSHVADFITGQGLDCSYYFFHKDQTGSVGLGPFLTHIAYQMALKDVVIQRQIFKLQDNSVSWQPRDERSIWRKLFVEGIFQVRFTSTQFWIIDALDECSGASVLFKLIQQVPDTIRIFVTSRNTPEIDRGIGSLGSRVRVYHLSVADTVSDMRSVIRAGLEILSLDAISNLESRLLSKSSSSFLWIRLVLQELETAFTEEDVQEILDEIPDDLYKVYERILDSIEGEKRRAKVAKSILFFVVLAVRPMTVEELCHAVQLQLNQTLHKMDQAIALACGQLVTIDQSGRVQIVHETAREFLLSERLNSTLAVPRSQGHGRLACLCMSYIDGQLQSRPVSWDLGAVRSPFSESVFLKYAATAFSQHLLGSEQNDSKPCNALLSLLDNKVFFWIEYIAAERSLNILSRTSMDIARYINQRAQSLPSVAVEKLKAWAMDLSRVAITFRDQLNIDPSAIHDLIPPLCPASSWVSRSVCNEASTLSVLGMRNSTWEDCLIRIETGLGVSAIGYGETYFAIGMINGEISVYDAFFLQHYIDLKLWDSPVHQLEFGCQDKYLAAAGDHSVRVWDPTSGSQLFKIPCSSWQAISFDTDILFIALARGDIKAAKLTTSEMAEFRWLPESVRTGPLRENRISDMVFSCPDQGLLAVAVYTDHVYIFDSTAPNLLGSCVGPTLARTIVFNPNPRMNALVVSYVDRSLAVFDIRTMTRTLTLPHMPANALTCSADGKYLIIGTQTLMHTIEVYEFGRDGDSITLRPVYRTNYPHREISGITSARRGLKFASIHTTECQIWDPSLHGHGSRQCESPGGSNTTASPTLGLQGPSPTRTRSEISAIVLSEDGKTALCGNEEGEILAFSTCDGSALGTLYQDQAQNFIWAIALAEREDQDLIITADWYGCITIAEACRSPERWAKANVLSQHESKGEVLHLLVSPAKDRMLAMRSFETTVLELPSGKLVNHRSIPKFGTKVRAAKNCPSDKDLFMIFEDDIVYLFNWSNFEPLEGHNLVIVREADLSLSQFPDAFHYQAEDIHVEMLADPPDGSRLNCWDAHRFSPLEDSRIMPRHGLQHLRNVINLSLLVSGSTLVFVDFDLWVCTVDLKTFASTWMARRHFFLLPEWINAFGDVMAVLTPAQDLVFVNKQDLVVIRDWMASSQTVSLPPGSEEWKVVSERQRDGLAVASASWKHSVKQRSKISSMVSGAFIKRLRIRKDLYSEKLGRALF